MSVILLILKGSYTEFFPSTVDIYHLYHYWTGQSIVTLNGLQILVAFVDSYRQFSLILNGVLAGVFQIMFHLNYFVLARGCYND